MVVQLLCFQVFNSQRSSLYVQHIVFNMVFLYSRLNICYIFSFIYRVWFTPWWMYVLNYHNKWVVVQLMSFQVFNSQCSSLYVQHIVFNMVFLYSRLNICYIFSFIYRVWFTPWWMYVLNYHNKWVVVQLMSFQGFRTMRLDVDKCETCQ